MLGDKIGIQLPVNPPELTFENDMCKYVEKTMLASVENLEDAMLTEIHNVAKEKGITKLIVLSKENIANAFTKQVAKTAYVQICRCPVCGDVLMPLVRYCSECGQKLDWKEKTNA